MSVKRVIFTGGSGKAGRHAVPYLVEKGYEILNLDIVKSNHPKVHTLITDLTDSGQVWNAFTSHFSMSEYEGEKVIGADAVIHFAAIPCNMIKTDNECFRNNVMSTYNVIEAACKLGIKKIIIASSETTYGVCFSQGDTEYHQFPLEEDYDVDPMDSYALSKICNEKTARSFQRRFGNDIYAYRIGNVQEPHEYAQNFAEYVNNPASRKRNAWSYIDARDLGQICHLSLQKSGLGFQVFNCTNDTITTTIPTAKYLKQACPNVKITREMDEWEAPLSNRKIRQVLGFKEEHNWRKYVTL